MQVKLSFILVACIAIVCVKAASLGDAILTVDASSIVLPSESDSELERLKREPEADPTYIRTHHHHLHHLHQQAAPQQVHHHHHHHHHHHENVDEGHYSKPTSCTKCGGGGGGNVATFAQSSAGTISTDGGHGGHGGAGSQAVSQSAAYNFGPFSASFSASQSSGNGGFYGGLF